MLADKHRRLGGRVPFVLLPVVTGFCCFCYGQGNSQKVYFFRGEAAQFKFGAADDQGCMCGHGAGGRRRGAGGTAQAGAGAAQAQAPLWLVSSAGWKQPEGPPTV